MIAAKPPLRQAPAPALPLLCALTALVLLLRAAYLVLWHPYGLAPDEAQYWTWLTHNDWSFLTKPPLTTWLMGLSTAVFGTTLLGVKFFALLGQAAVSVLGALTAAELSPPPTREKALWWAWVLLTTVPLVAGGGLIMSPDAVLLPLWFGAVYSVVRALNKPDAEALCWPRWLLIGALIGLGGLAKYSAVFFYPLLGVYLLAFRREWLLKPQIWVSGVVALAFQAPMLVWNIQHHWVGFEHVAWQVQTDNDNDELEDALERLVQYVGGQFLVLGPVIGALVIGAFTDIAARKTRFANRPLVWVMLGCAAIVLGFAGLTFTSKVQANWPVLGTTMALVPLAVWLAQSRKKWGVYVAVAGVVLNSLLTLMLMDTYLARHLHMLPLKAKNDPTKDLRGWQDMGMLVQALFNKLDKPILLSSRYQTLAPLVFHTPEHPEFAYVNAEGRRLNEYDLWPLPDMANRVVVYVNEQDNLPPKVAAMFGQCAPYHNLATEDYDGIVTRRLYLWLCWGGVSHAAK